ncbi:hypothetical protein FBEOM_14123 [Fusarium beomiforme]|uniref:F-box domain-containing protein n=1 Tax=Fusarium beomiforme TaxID=44412 RepID=A0A9P5A522_9HYPO|nr:hypothetical protein FBEOM_14123 [Fusarium beomiforme]
MSIDSAPSGTLETLPLELRTQIASHLVASNSTKSIHSLASTCKSFHDFFVPFAVQSYSTVGIGRSHPWPRNKHLKFLRHIALSRPELARHVQTLNLHSCYTESLGKDTGFTIQADEWPVYKRVIRETFPSEDQSEIRLEWIKGLEEEWEDASIALLLAVCSNVKTLIYRTPIKPSIFLSVLNAGINNHSGTKAGISVSRLENIRHQDNHRRKLGLYETWKFDDDIINLLQMPSLRSYGFINSSLSEDCYGVTDQVPKKSLSIDSISFIDSFCPIGVLESLTDMYSSLRAFTYTRGQDKKVRYDMTPRDIIRAMRPYSDTLEYLHIDSVDPWHQEYFDIPPLPFWTYVGVELKELRKLKHLTLLIDCLKGIFNPFGVYPDDDYCKDEQLKTLPPPPFAECIPEQLEQLEIRGCTPEDLPRLTELVKALGSFPKLQYVRFAFKDDDGWKEKPKDVVIQPCGPAFDMMQSDQGALPWPEVVERTSPSPSSAAGPAKRSFFPGWSLP